MKVNGLPESRIFSEENFALALAYIDNIGANMGGTNILDPLDVVLKPKGKSKYKRQVFLLTDGGVGNTDRCIHLGDRL